MSEDWRNGYYRYGPEEAEDKGGCDSVKGGSESIRAKVKGAGKGGRIDKGGKKGDKGGNGKGKSRMDRMEWLEHQEMMADRFKGGKGTKGGKPSQSEQGLPRSLPVKAAPAAPFEPKPPEPRYPSPAAKTKAAPRKPPGPGSPVSPLPGGPPLQPARPQLPMTVAMTVPMTAMTQPKQRRLHFPIFLILVLEILGASHGSEICACTSASYAKIMRLLLISNAKNMYGARQMKKITCHRCFTKCHRSHRILAQEQQASGVVLQQVQPKCQLRAQLLFPMFQTRRLQERLHLQSYQTAWQTRHLRLWQT